MNARRVVLGVVLGLALLGAQSPSASPRYVPEVYHTVAGETGVPADVLYAVALAESGKRIATGSLRPYPWTVVTRGAPARYASKHEAVEAVVALLREGVTNIDVGLMQTNLHWHGYRYASVEAALDPSRNVRTGAQILIGEYESGACERDWWCAVGRYHSYRKSLGGAYTQRVKQFHDSLHEQGQG